MAEKIRSSTRAAGRSWEVNECRPEGSEMDGQEGVNANLRWAEGGEAAGLEKVWESIFQLGEDGESSTALLCRKKSDDGEVKRMLLAFAQPWA